MADIAPELYEKIKEIFDRKYAQAQILGESLGDIMGRINDGTATFRDADMFAVEVGAMMADAMKQVLVLEDLPGGQLYRNIAQRTIGEGLKDTYGIMSNVVATIQEEMNGRNGIGLKAVKPKLETERVDKIVEKAAAARTQESLDATLTESVPTFARQVVDDSQKANARLHNKAGLSVKVEREYDGVGLHDGEDACQWCLDRAGTWTYEQAMANGVFERHEGCGCIIEYTSRKGERTVSTGKYSGWDTINNPEKHEQDIIPEAENISPKQLEQIVKLQQDGGTASIPQYLEGDFSDFSPLSISDEEREMLRELHEMSMEDRTEHGKIILQNGNVIECHSNSPDGVQMPISDIDEIGIKMYHSHTNDTPQSSMDLSKLLIGKVDEVGVVTNNRDVFIARIGDGWVPTAEEFGEFVKTVAREIDSELPFMPGFNELSLEERNYIAIREQAYRICREYGWSLDGGKLDK